MTKEKKQNYTKYMYSYYYNWYEELALMIGDSGKNRQYKTSHFLIISCHSCACSIKIANIISMRATQKIFTIHSQKIDIYESLAPRNFPGLNGIYL